ncbi:MAG: hypothetical protein R6V50_00930 [Thermoplasmatota archaeon]
MKKTSLPLVILFIVFFISFVSSVSADQFVRVEFFYSQSCGSCKPAHDVIDDIVVIYAEEISTGQLVFDFKETSTNRTNYDEMISRRLSFPVAIISSTTINETIVRKNDITNENMIRILDMYLANLPVDEPYDPLAVDIPFFGRVNMTSFSLPVLTVILGGLDSINPCSFFILIFLLNLLLYMRSRRRMALVGGIFVFFSGFFYFLFMFLLIHTLIVTAASMQIISLGAGSIAIIFGILNIKDFFTPKKGPSLSISEQARPKIFQRMRSLVHTTKLSAVLSGAVFLAVTVNFYELLCTLGFPLVFTSILAMHNLPMSQYYLYILLYNIVYVIPLIAIVCIFVVSLGRWKLSEFQGQQLKLFSGLMIFSFGILFLVNYQLLSLFFTPIFLLLLCIVITVVISRFWEFRKKSGGIIHK